MGKWIGIVLLLGGIAGYLYSWICGQKEKQQRRHAFIVFLQKSIFAMETEKVRLIEFFTNYSSKDAVLTETLQEIANRLSMHLYPDGSKVWQDVFLEKKSRWNMDEETFDLMQKAGEGFFGRSREENICFLQKSIKELEIQQQKMKEKEMQQRKVWVPVGMLGGIMLVIIFL